MAIIKSQSKLIQSLSMHMQHMDSGNHSKNSSFLASASDEFPIHILDLRTLLNPNRINQQVALISELEKARG